MIKIPKLDYTIPNPIEVLSSNVKELDYVEYKADTVYNKGDNVTVKKDKKNYRCTDNNIKGKTPKDFKEFWEESPTNRHKMFSYKNSSKTENKDCIEVIFTVEDFDRIALFGLDAYSVYLKIEDAQDKNIILEKEFDLAIEDIQDFADYLFAEREYKNKIITGAVTIFSTKVTLKIKKEGSIAKCAYVVLGREKELGVALNEGYKESFYTTGKELRNAWGEVVIREGKVYDNVDIKINIPNTLREQTKKRIKELKGTPALYSLTGEPPMFAIYKDQESEHGGQTTNYILRLTSIIEG